MTIDELARTGYPRAIIPPGHIEAVPRRIRAFRDEGAIVDTTAAMYLWEHAYYPTYYLPVGDLHPDLLAQISIQRTDELLPGYVAVEWSAADRWFEEDEEIFVHPRSPYVRVDALRSTRNVRIELEGELLAESSSPVMLFETGLPTRYYLAKTTVEWPRLIASETRTACPYKGRTTGYWSVKTEDVTQEDIAWSYDFPVNSVAPIAGLVCFLTEKVDVFLDGTPQKRPGTKLS